MLRHTPSRQARPARSIRPVPLAAALGGALSLLVALGPGRAAAASCCGGGGGATAIVGRGERAMLDLGLEAERYHGYWDGSGQHKPDPVGSSLAQYRVTLAGAARLAEHWQAGAALPLVFNDNRFGQGGLSEQTHGLGDAAASLWWEALDQRSAWRLASAADLVPDLSVGATLTVPTGVSPYDDVASSFDVTGRGFWRLDATLLAEKGYRAWSASLSLAYGVAFERWANRTYGGWETPYRVRPGDRATASLSLGHRLFLGTGGHTLSTTAAFSWLHEARGTRDGQVDPATGLEKTAGAVTVTWSSTDSDWSARAGLAHAFRRDGWGRNFPTTDTFSLGVRRAFR